MRLSAAGLLARKALANLAGKRCYAVRYGGSAGSTFHLALGERVRITPPRLKSALLRRLAAKETSSERCYRPEFGLMVWSSWRLFGKKGLLASSQALSAKELVGLSKLKGLHVEEIRPGRDFLDLRLCFSKGLVLDVFCDKGRLAPTDDPAASAGANWEIFVPNNFLVGA